MMTGSQAEGVLLCLAPGGGKQERGVRFSAGGREGKRKPEKSYAPEGGKQESGAAAASGQGYLEVYRRDENL